MSYQAIITRLTNVREHPNADRLCLATVAGHQVVSGIGAEEGQLGVFFPSDGKLSTEYCVANDLYPVLDENGKRIGGGFFDPKNNRVRSQKFRGEKSEGYFAPIESLAYTGANLDDLYEGYQFDVLNNQVVCEKYYTPQTLKAMKGNVGKTRKDNPMFAKHIDTLKYKYEVDNCFIPGAICTFTEKLHGTSQRVGYVLETKPGEKKWYHKLFKRTPAETTEWSFIVGTRNIVLKDPLVQGFYEDESFRFDTVEDLRHNLKKGEVIYGEMVGYTNTGGLIMGAQDTKDLKDVKAAYGPRMEYTYGTVPSQTEFYVYRITRVNEDGDAIDLSWNQVKARCGELGIKYVPELATNAVLFGPHPDDVTVVKQAVDHMTEGASTLDERHIREGVVIRVELPSGETKWLKSKSFTFGILEGYLKNSDDYVDTEEVS